MIIKQTERKAFEQPDAGLFAGTIIDVVELGVVKSTYNGVESENEKVQVIWVLDKNDSQGRPFRVQSMYNANINMNPKSGKKSRLYELIEQVFQVAPTLEFDSEALVGRANNLFLVKETNPTTGKTYTNVKGLAPLSAGQVAPKAPADFVRFKNRPKTQTATGQPVQSGQTQAAPAAAVASNDVAF